MARRSTAAPAIRGATRADDERLAKIDRLTWSPQSSPGPRPRAGGPFFERGLEPGNVLVAELDGVLAGYVAIGRATRLDANAHVRAIHGLAVDPAYQRRGIARALLAAAAAEARRRGARRLTLRVLAANREARRLYEAVGFETEGTLREEFRIGEGYVDDVLMALRL
ncbi:MAG: GNAT family N-acetyltransferase [Solirubrobacterales bacterium]|nr:GNAT family N-acetyltransferase [Solirubrobacterales bacterium]MBV9716259.1 GNAT family N-acetyltransferase [Solirubrobacterales bacterium]